MLEFFENSNLRISFSSMLPLQLSSSLLLSQSQSWSFLLRGICTCNSEMKCTYLPYLHYYFLWTNVLDIRTGKGANNSYFSFYRRISTMCRVEQCVENLVKCPYFLLLLIYKN